MTISLMKHCYHAQNGAETIGHFSDFRLAIEAVGKLRYGIISDHVTGRILWFDKEDRRGAEYVL